MHEEEKIELSIRLLLSSTIEHDPARDLNTISEYFGYIASNIDYEELEFRISKNLLDSFEPVCLILRERLTQCTTSVSAEVEKILGQQKLGELFATVANLSTHELKSIRRADWMGEFGSFGNVISVFISLFFTFRVKKYGLTTERIFEGKVALHRISQILRAINSIETDIHEQSFESTREHFDPDLVNRNKLLALISLLRVELEQVPDENIRSQVKSKIAEVEEEVRKPKPKWGKAIILCFILLGVMADLKTLKPDIYDRPYRIVTQILTTIQEDGIVQHSKEIQLLVEGEAAGQPSKNQKDSRTTQPLLPSSEPRMKNEDQDNSSI